MTIHFDSKRWQSIFSVYDKWWNNGLDRPLIRVVIDGFDADREKPSIPAYPFASFYGFEVSPEQIIDVWDYDLSTKRFAGDSFPFVMPNFGPVFFAAFLGADLVNGQDTVWFNPKESKKIDALELAYESQNKWFVRIKEIYRAAIEKWQGQVQIGMTDLGANLDVLSVYRPSEQLIYDLYDHPDAVIEKTWQIHYLWHKYFDELNAILQPTNPGYSSWEGFYSAEPFYMLQCDFSYMIGQNMFKKFVLPELVESCRKLGNSFYHLDGPGALKHLDILLDIDELGGIQWVPGAGQDGPSKWVDIHKKILNSGKNLHLINGDTPFFDCDTADKTLQELDGGENTILFVSADKSQQKQVEKLLEKYLS